MSKLISVTMEGPLLPLGKKGQCLPANLSTHYLMVWLQLLADGKTNSWLSSTELENSKVSTSLNARFAQNYSTYAHVRVESKRGRN